MENENNPDDSYTEGTGMSTEDESNVSSTDVLSAINSATNRSYKTTEEALKGIQETVSYVGKVGKYKGIIEAIEAANGGEKGAIEALKSVAGQKNDASSHQPVDDDVKRQIEELREENFFIANSNLAPHKELIKRLKKPGQSLSDVVSENKDIIDRFVASEEIQGSRSIIHSNSRTVVDESDYAKDFKKAKETGNWAEFVSKHKRV